MAYPVFCAEVFTEATVASFTVTVYGAVNVTIPAGTYWRGGDAGSLAAAVVAALNVAGFGPVEIWSYVPTALSQNLGASCQLRVSGALTNRTITATNGAAERVLWALGFRAATSVTLTGNLVLRSIATTGIPFGTWWPKAHIVDVESYRPAVAQVATSALPGSGFGVGFVRQDDRTQGRWWREFRLIGVDAARVSQPRAVSQYTAAWAQIAGLTTNPGDAALDAPDWWWSRTVDGSRRFICIEDETALISGTPRWGEYRIVYDPTAPVGMEGWAGLRDPNVTRYANAGGRMSLEFCAIQTSRGNL